MSYIRTIPPNQDGQDEALKKAYEQLGPASKAHILQVHSLHPAAMSTHFELYKTLVHQKSPLSRAFRELVAFAVSRWNQCHY